MVDHAQILLALANCIAYDKDSSEKYGWGLSLSAGFGILDLFCGGGGFALGAHLAGFKTILSVDIDKILSSSVPLNFPGTTLEHHDLASAQLAAHPLVKNNKITGIIGGPPCQGFSTIGKRDQKDPRNELVSHFFRHVKEIDPLFFVMENVPGILVPEAKDIIDREIDKLSKKYVVLPAIELDASDYGAPTSRKRVIIIGYKNEHCDSITLDDLYNAKVKKKITVEDAISDLPDPARGKLCEHEFEWLSYPENRKISSFAKQARKKPTFELGWNFALDQLNIGLISGNQTTIHSDEIAQRYAATPGGTRDAISKSYRLQWHSQCPTLRAGTGPDRGSFNAVRPLHPDEGRVITVREAARLQGFPDWFTFHRTKWHSFRMIGNSVSPKVSQVVLEIIAKKMDRILLGTAAA